MRNKIYLIFVFAIAFAGCATKNPCPSNPAVGNLGGLFNSNDDEYSPFFYNNTLYFTATSKEKKKQETIYKSEFIDERFSRPLNDTMLPLRNFQNAGLPVFFDNPKTGATELYFAAVIKNGKINRNLLFSEKIGEKWSNPIPIAELNTSSYESHPNISPDGTTLVFSSDREGVVGGIDLFVSKRTSGGSWSKPENISSINTAGNEISPHIASDGSLYFASQGYSGTKDYNIIKADPDGKGGWKSPRSLPFPINSEGDETGPAIFKDKIFLASSRRGGCGGIDLYAFQICGPVSLECLAVSSLPDFPLSGVANLYDETNSIVNSRKVDAGGKFKFDLQPSKNYKVEYINDCRPEFSGTKSFFAPCSDSNIVVIKAMFEFTPQDEYDLAEVKVPFFVSGYYMPNTRENLDALRLKFAYNLIGTDEGTQYIEKPDEQYDGFVEEVESALDAAAEHLYSIVSGLRKDCQSRDDAKIQISVTGFADARSISPQAVFPDAEIIDQKFDFYLTRGTSMDNILLSKLRAYYTAKYFERYINDKDKTGSINAKLIWKIEGKGVDSTEIMPDKMKRRVNIKIKAV